MTSLGCPNQPTHGNYVGLKLGDEIELFGARESMFV